MSVNRTAVLALVCALALVGIVAAGTAITTEEPKMEFTLDAALPPLYLSFSVYCPVPDVETGNCTWCGFLGDRFHTVGYFSTPKDMEGGNTFGLVGYMDDVIYVVYRGSDGAINWKYNFHFKMTAYPACEDCKVHLGFAELFVKTRETVRKLTAQAQNECKTCKRVVVTGHSLGAALAVLGALDLVHEEVVGLPVTMLNFGGPRVGNKAFAEYSTDLVTGGFYRVVQGADPAPHLPLQAWGYFHSGTEVWNRKGDQEFIICETKGHGQSFKCSEKQFPLWNLLDHALYLGLNVLHEVDGKAACKDLSLPKATPPMSTQKPRFVL